MDITHYDGRHFLTVINNGPSQFMIWQPIQCQNSVWFVSWKLFFVSGAHQIKFLTDNDASFTCWSFRNILKDWGVWLWLQCAYASARNGIVQRCPIAARKQCTGTRWHPKPHVTSWDLWHDMIITLIRLVNLIKHLIYKIFPLVKMGNNPKSFKSALIWYFFPNRCKVVFILLGDPKQLIHFVLFSAVTIEQHC